MEIAELNIPVDGILYTSKDVKLKIEDTEISNGAVYITERSFSWKPEERAEGISIPWPQISLHAIQSQPVPSIYIMVDSNIVWPGVYDGNENGVINDNNDHQNDDDDNEKDEGNESDDENPPTTLMWLRPKDPNTLDIIFQAMQKAQSLNPDPTSDRTSDEDDEFMEAENIDDEDEYEEYEDVGQDDMRNLHIENEDKFADAEEE